MCSCIETVSHDEVAIVEYCGAFHKLAYSGLLLLPAPICVKVGVVNQRMQQLPVKVETKTKDNVFVEVDVQLQYQAHPDKIYEAFYMLTNRRTQLTSFVFQVILGTVPKLNLDDLFLSKDHIADEVKARLAEPMKEYGFAIIKALVTDITPALKVREAMNDIETSKRLRLAAVEKAESNKIIVVKLAEADSEAKYHQGAGIARQRKAIIEGMKSSVGTFSEAISDIDPKAAMELIILTQFFEMLKEIGQSSNCNTVFLGNNPGAVNSIGNEIRDSFMQTKAS